MGVSGGGGEPLWARVVEVEAVELIRFMPDCGGWRFEEGLGVEFALEACCGGG